MNLWGRIFGSEKALEKAVDGVSRGIDALVYTKEEREAQKAALLSEARGMLIDWLQASSGQNIARRFLAVIIAVTWLLQYIVSMGLNVAAIWMDDPGRVLQSASLIGDYADGMTGAMMLILTFYFAAPHLGDIIKPAMERFGKRPAP